MLRETDEEDYAPEPDPRGGCKFLPGSEGKVIAICERHDNGWALWHPGDAVLDDNSKVTDETPGISAYKLGGCLEASKLRTTRLRGGLHADEGIE
jgi:hypothetical protein